MQRVPFCVVTVLILSCCLAFSLFASPQAFAGVVKAQHDLRVATVLAIPSHQDHELIRDPLPLVLDSGDEVGHPFDKRVDIANDLRRIYTGPIEVKGSDLCLLMIGAGTMLLMDEDIYDMINSGPKSPEDRQISGIVTELGNSLSALAICGLISTRDRETAYLAANAVAYSGIACLTLKAAFGRARPWQGEGPHSFAGPRINDAYSSMPSGHTATAFALATVLANRYPKYKHLFYACASVIALSRVYVNAHWPSDVLAGAAVGVWSANHVMRNSSILEIRW